LKGTIAYILSYISQNKNIKNILESNNYSYFFNTDICYPNDIREIYLNSKPNYINRKINEEADKISKLINLPAPIEEIYNNLLCLINGISFRQAMNELDETSKNKPKNFFDVNLLIKVYIILSKYKYKQLARRSILSYLEKAINSNDFAKDANKILKMVGNDVLTAHHLE
jgi:ribosomal protein L22